MLVPREKWAKPCGGNEILEWVGFRPVGLGRGVVGCGQGVCQVIILYSQTLGPMRRRVYWLGAGD